MRPPAGLRDIPTPLHEGKLIRWELEKGFGFIRPADGGRDVFVHIRAVAGGQVPALGSRMVFSAEDDPRGRGQRALQAIVAAADGRVPLTLAPLAMRTGSADRNRPPQPAATRPRRRNLSLRAPPLDSGMLIITAATLFCLWGAASALPVSPIPLLAYPVFSLAAFLLYARDKSNAIRGTRRVAERSLHLVELAGGWPGAWLAQQTMRHKTVKERYQVIYWLLVSIHLCFWALWVFAPDAVRPFFTPGALDHYIGVGTWRLWAPGSIEWSR